MSRTIIITGATGKFGKILVGKFIDNGDIVIAVGRSINLLENLKFDINRNNENLYLVQTDLMVDDSISKVIKSINNYGLQPDSLINNARNLDYLKLNKEGRASSENFLNEFKLGVVVPYQFTMSLADAFKKSFKNVLNIGSIYGSVVPNLNLYDNPNNDSSIQYGVTKSALEKLTKELSVRLAKKSIRVNCAAFGGLESQNNDKFKKRYSNLCPSGRMLNENDIFGPINMLLSENTNSVTGHVLMIDGGWTLW
tara:strand:+ start:3824 stop:4582 length:759 start_codon:yes stop_codon:yes gene_type:complete